MAWTYSDWDGEATTAAKLAKLILHIQEVTDAIDRKMMSDGTAVDPAPLVELRKDLRIDRNRLAGGGSRLTRGRIIKK